MTTADAYEAVAKTRRALAELRDTLRSIPRHDPFVSPERQPTAHDACALLLENIDHSIHLIEVYVGPPPASTQGLRPPNPPPPPVGLDGPPII